MLFNAATVLVLAAVARAIQITSPTNTTTWVSGQPQTITWDSVSTDPSTVDIKIEIPNKSQIETKTVAENVDVSKGSYSYTPDTDIQGSQYRITFFGTDKNNQGIVAQSGYFDVEAGSASASASSSATDSAVSGASTASGSSATATGSQTGATGSLTATGSQTAGASVSSGATTTGNATIPNTTPSSGAMAIVPSLALVGGSLVALLL